MTPVPAVEPDAVTAFWARCIAARVVADGAPVPSAAEHFGDNVALADELLDLVLNGQKRATAAAVAEFEQSGEPLPEVGGLWIACDGRGRPRALLRTTEVRVGPLSSVDDAFAWDEGEGDRTRASWLADHHAYFSRALPAAGLEFSPDLPTVFERFEVTYRE